MERYMTQDDYDASEEVINELTSIKTINLNSIELPAVGSTVAFDVMSDSGETYRIKIESGSAYGDYTVHSEWDFTIYIQGQSDSTLLSLDYGDMLNNHHHDSAHIHLGKDRDNWFVLDDSIFNFFPFIYVPSQEDIDNPDEYSIISAVQGFLQTCGVWEDIDIYVRDENK